VGLTYRYSRKSFLSHLSRPVPLAMAWAKGLPGLDELIAQFGPGSSPMGRQWPGLPDRRLVAHCDAPNWPGIDLDGLLGGRDDEGH
jgi:hypothetical protein